MKKVLACAALLALVAGCLPKSKKAEAEEETRPEARNDAKKSDPVKRDPEKVAKANEPEEVLKDSVWSRWNENAAAAEAKFAGKLVEVRALAAGITKSKTQPGKWVLHANYPGSPHYPNNGYACFFNGNTPDLQAVQVKLPVVVTGRVRGFEKGLVVLTDCTATVP